MLILVKLNWKGWHPLAWVCSIRRHWASVMGAPGSRCWGEAMPFHSWSLLSEPCSRLCMAPALCSPGGAHMPKAVLVLTTTLFSSKPKGKAFRVYCAKKGNSLVFSAQAFRTKYLQLGDWNHRHFFFRALREEEVQEQMHADSVLVRALFLVYRWPCSCCVLTC